MENKYGFQAPEIDHQKDYVFGDASFSAEILAPDGNWSPYIPKDELQNLQAVEPYACATFGTFNCLETLIKRIYSQDFNFSDRYTAYITGTFKNFGNDPQTIIESIRHAGAVPEEMWPFTKDIDTFQKYYTTPPSYLSTIAFIIPNQWKINHDYVPTNPKKMMEALRYSPLGSSVTAWNVPDSEGIYSWSPEEKNTHWVEIYNYVEGKYWMIFDSYDNTHKKIAWNAKFGFVKRYSIVKLPATPQNTPFLIALFQQTVHYLTEQLANLKQKVGAIFTP